MVLTGSFKFLGVERRQGFKDPSKFFNVLGLGQGMDVLRIYIDDLQFGSFSGYTPYSDIDVQLDYNPVSTKNPIRLLNVLKSPDKALSSVKSA